MTLYHGTSTNYLPQIMREGLRSKKRNRFHLANLFGYPGPPYEPTPAVYVSRSRPAARDYAEFRAEYHRAAYRQIVAPFNRIGAKVKMARKQIADAWPVVLRLEVPDEWMQFAAPDDQDHSGEAYWFARPIPPEYIKEVITQL